MIQPSFVKTRLLPAVPSIHNIYKNSNVKKPSERKSSNFEMAPFST